MPNPEAMSNPGNPLYRRRSDFKPRHVRQQRVLGIATAIAALVLAYSLWGHAGAIIP